jgi:hypothetical protein
VIDRHTNEVVWSLGLNVEVNEWICRLATMKEWNRQQSALEGKTESWVLKRGSSCVAEGEEEKPIEGGGSTLLIHTSSAQTSGAHPPRHDYT